MQIRIRLLLQRTIAVAVLFALFVWERLAGQLSELD